MSAFPSRHLCILLCLLTLSFESRAQSFINPSLEQWAVLGICETNLAPDFWVNFSNGGLGPDEGNYPLCPSTIPGSASNGSVYARYMAGNPRSGEGMAQTVAGFSPGKPYAITFDFAGSNLWGGSDSMRAHVFIDGVDIDSTDKFSSLDTVWRHHRSVFIPTASMHTIGFRVYTHRFPSAGGSGALDNFGLEQFVISSTAGQVVEPDWEIYPTVFKDEFYLKGPSGRKINCQLFDIAGRLVFETEAESGVPIRPEIPGGLYEVLIRFDSAFPLNKKIIRSHE